MLGCGGEKPRDALAGWSKAARRDCERAGKELRAPRPPVTLEELAQAAPEAVEILDEAAVAIERREVPDEARGLVRPFLREMGTLRRHLRAAGDAARHGDTEATSAAILAASRQVPALERAAGRADVRACGDAKRLTALLDAGRGPIFLWALRRVTGDATRVVSSALRNLEGQRIEVQANALSDASNAIEEAHTRLSGFDNPTWAETASDRYLDKLDEVNNALVQIWDALDSVNLGSLELEEVRPQLVRGARRLQRASVAEARAARELNRLMRDRLLGDDGGGVGQIGRLS